MIFATKYTKVIKKVHKGLQKPRFSQGYSMLTPPVSVKDRYIAHIRDGIF